MYWSNKSLTSVLIILNAPSLHLQSVVEPFSQIEHAQSTPSFPIEKYIVTFFPMESYN